MVCTKSWVDGCEAKTPVGSRESKLRTVADDGAVAECASNSLDICAVQLTTHLCRDCLDAIHKGIAEDGDTHEDPQEASDCEKMGKVGSVFISSQGPGQGLASDLGATHGTRLP